ncbi:MAG: hypothetical protein ABR506_03645 [Candidatus Krumholzibacteriia bacterium]
MHHRVRSLVLPVVLSAAVSAALPVAGPAPALAWEQPDHWAKVGEVATWKSLDIMFYRLWDDPVFLDRSQDAVDQQAAYARTLAYGGRLDAVSLDAWFGLPAEERDRRAGLASGELNYVRNFRRRIEEQVQRTRQNQPSGWGIGVADVTAVGDCLQRLRTATGLDPSNPYAWHLEAWFASCVGDLDRTAGALAGAGAALTRVPADELLGVRRGVALDQAWLAWERGRIRAAAEAVDHAASLGADIFQVTLLRGLTAARLGNQAGAFAAANKLRQVAIRRFPMNYRTSGSAPELNNVSVWAAVPSDYAERWIKALSWIEAGQPQMAAKAFGSYRSNDIYPQAHRFWNDAGLIYELTGRRDLARKAWGQARITTPFAPYFPVRTRSHDLGRLTGRPGDLPVHLGFDRFPIAGSRLAFAALLVERMDRTADEAARQGVGADALDELDLSGARGHHPAQAALLRGAVYHRLGDLESAVIEVESALRLLDHQGDAPGYQAVLDQLAQVRTDRSRSGIQAFFGQAGSARGRWASVQDPAAELDAARRAYADEASDASRRDLARLLIRTGDVAAGRALVADRRQAPDLELTLEADRVLGDASLAVSLADAYARTGEDPWNDPGLWTLVGFICLDAGQDALGQAALARALELDPGNQGLRIQLRLMQKAAQG